MNSRTGTIDVRPLILLPIALLAIVALSFLIVLYPDIAKVALWVLVWSLILGVILLKFSAHYRRFLIPSIIIGVLIRLMIAIFFRLSNADTAGLITPDEFYYFNNAKDIADAWKSGVFLSLDEIYNLVGTRNYGYHIYDALHFLILEEKLLPVISNIFLNILTALIIFKFTLKNFGNKSAKLVFLLLIFNPFLIYWSTFNLKDTVLAFLIALFLYTASNAKKNILYIVSIILLLVLISTLRFYLAFILIGIMAIINLLDKEYKIEYRLVLGIAIAVSIATLYFYTPLQDTFNELVSEGVVQTYHTYSTRSFAIAQTTDFSTKFIRGHDPKSMLISSLHALLAPSPLNLSGSGKYLIFGSLFWYFLLPYYVLGTLIFLKSKKLRLYNLLLWLFPLAMLSVMVMLPAINEPRHRVVIYPYVTVLIAVGIYSKFRNKYLIIATIYLIIVVAVVGREMMV